MSDDASAAVTGGGRKRLLTRLAASLVVAAAFVWFLRAGALPVLPSRAELAGIGVGHIALAALLWTAMQAVRTLRWQLLVASVSNVPPRRVAGVALVGFAAAVIMPLRTGEAVRPLLFGRAGGSPWAAAGTVAAERVIDAAFISTALLVCLRLAQPLDPLPHQLGSLPIDVALVPRGATLAAAAFVAIFAGLLVFYRFRDWSRRIAHAVLAPLSEKFAAGVTKRLEELTEGLAFLTRARVNVPFLLLTTVYWALNAAGLWVLTRGPGLSTLSFAGAWAAVGVMAVGITLPSAPGLFGAYQLGLYAGLLLFLDVGIVTSAGAAVVFVMYSAQVLVHVLGGLLGAMLLGPARPAASDAPPAR